MPGVFLLFAELWALPRELGMEQSRRQRVTCLMPRPYLLFRPCTSQLGVQSHRKVCQGLMQDMAEGMQRCLNDLKSSSFDYGETEAHGEREGRREGSQPPPLSPALSLKRDLRYSQSHPHLSLALQLWEPPACDLPNVAVSWPSGIA